MSSFNSTYIQEVLGVKNYLCPEDIFHLRALKGRWPSEALVVTAEPLLEQEKELLKKIMHSSGLSNFAVLEIKDKSYLESFLKTLSSKSIAKYTIVFDGDKTTQHEFFLQTYSLKKLIGSSQDINSKKRELWLKLKQWKN